MGNIGFSFVLIPGRSAQRVVSLSRCSLMDFTRVWRAKSCHQVYLPCSASGQLKRIRWITGCLWPHRRQLDLFSASIVSDLVEWGECTYSLPDLIEIPTLQLEGSYFEQLAHLSCFSITCCLNSLLQWLLRVLLEMFVIDNLALSSRLTTDGWIL